MVERHRMTGRHIHDIACDVISWLSRQGVRNPWEQLENRGGRSSVVEFQPSKLAVAGSNPVARSMRAEHEGRDVKRDVCRGQRATPMSRVSATFHVFPVCVLRPT